jgi:hypothetical protein
VTALGQRVAPIVEAYTSAMEARRIKDGIRLAMDVSREGNAFFQVWRTHVCFQVLGSAAGILFLSCGPAAFSAPTPRCLLCAAAPGALELGEDR